MKKKDIAVGKAYLGRDGKVRRVIEIRDDTVRYTGLMHADYKVCEMSLKSFKDWFRKRK